MTIAEKILKVMQEVEYLKKDDTVSFGQTKYKALSEEKVTTAMRSKLVEVGAIVYPKEMHWTRTGNVTHVDVMYRLQNVEDPTDYIDVVSCGDGYDTQDKGAGKEMTYAYKYMWLRVFAIPTGEDPDKISTAEIEASIALEKKAADGSRDAIIKEIKGLCKEHNVNYDVLIMRRGMQEDTMTLEDATKLLATIKEKLNA